MDAALTTALTCCQVCTSRPRRGLLGPPRGLLRRPAPNCCCFGLHDRVQKKVNIVLLIGAAHLCFALLCPLTSPFHLLLGHTLPNKRIHVLRTWDSPGEQELGLQLPFPPNSLQAVHFKQLNPSQLRCSEGFWFNGNQAALRLHTLLLVP